MSPRRFISVECAMSAAPDRCLQEGSSRLSAPCRKLPIDISKKVHLVWVCQVGCEPRLEEDPNRLQAIDPNLGGYTQWVRWRAPTGKKLPQAQSSTSTRKKTLRMTLRVTRRLG